MTATTLYTGITQLATPPRLGVRRGVEMQAIDVIEDAVIAVVDGTVMWAGPKTKWHSQVSEEVDLGGVAVVPALVDPHTHIIWGGDRLADFEARAAGVGYEQLLARGGGIRRTVQYTSGASVVDLITWARPRIDALVASGAATIEIKSGYGGSRTGELASLEAIAAIRDNARVRIVPTLLIHLPPSHVSERAAYLRMVLEDLIPEVIVRNLASAVDVFIERDAWQPSEAALIFAAARKGGLLVKAHVDQFNAIGGVATAIEHGAISVDHLEASGTTEIRAISESNTIATLLPGVTLHLGIGAAPGRALIDAGAAVAVATDLNPGSSPLFSTQLAMALSVRLNGLVPAEALTAATVNAAAALGLNDRGAIVAGGRADFAVLHDADWRSIVYQMGGSPVAQTIMAGQGATP